MPTRTHPNRATDKLVSALAERVKAPGGAEEPFVLQDRVPQTRTRHVVVIWNEWANVDRDERSRVILDAYDRAGVLGHDSITSAMGLTTQEALDLGYLPYSIITMRKNSDPLSSAELERAMERIGGAQFRQGALLQVRFPPRELAEGAYRRLLEAVPGPYWGIQYEKAQSELH